MSKPFKELRLLLFRNDIDQIYLGELMKKSRSYICSRMMGKMPWTQDDQYFLMDLLNIPYAQMHIYFSKHGKAA